MRTIVAIGGGELRNKSTLKIDGYVAKLAKIHAKDKRAYGLFIGTASHDSMPYFNTFRKTYTSEFDIKADCALTVYGEMDFEKIKGKFEKADLIYIGGGNTIFMLDSWKKSGIFDLIMQAYDRGVIIAGLSAGAIFWFKTMYTDSVSNSTEEPSYDLHDGIGILDKVCTPHYNHRIDDFHKVFIKNNLDVAYCIEDDSCLVFNDEKLTGSVSSGGNSYIIRNNCGKIEKFLIDEIDDSNL